MWKAVGYFFIFAFVAYFFLAGSFLWTLTKQFSGPFPGADIARPPDLPLEDIVFEDELGSRLVGWIVPGQKGQGVVLLLHGYSVHRNILIKRARFLHQAGYTVMLFDFQGHGQSSGDRVTFGYREYYNVVAAMKILRERFPKEKIGIVATSMGAVSVFSRGRSVSADAYVLESPFMGLRRFFEYNLLGYFGSNTPFYSSLFVKILSYRLGFDVENFVPVDGLKDLSGPLLMIAAGQDAYVTVAETMTFYAYAPEPKELWIIPGIPHGDYSHTVPEKYQKRVLGFLRLHLRGERTGSADLQIRKAE